MSIFQLAIYAYIALVFVCLILVAVGFVSRRILGTKAHKKLMTDLQALKPKLETLPSNRQVLANDLSGLIIPIDHYGWSGAARKELQVAIDTIATEANRIEAKLAAERKLSVEQTHVTTQKAEDAAVRAEKAVLTAGDAAKKAEDAANRALELTRKAEELATKEATKAREAQELGATEKLDAARQAIKDAVKKYAEGRGANAETVPESSVMTTLIAGGNLNLALNLLPGLLFSHYFALILRVSPAEKVLFDHRLTELRRTHQNEPEFRSEAQKFLDEMARRVEQRGVVTQEGETSETS